MENHNLRWQKVLDFFKSKFTDGESPQMDTILFLIGVQELGMIKPSFTKDEKLNLMHVATCKLLEPFGYYEFDRMDEEGWPHYKPVKVLETDKIQQEQLMQEAIVNYFTSNSVI